MSVTRKSDPSGNEAKVDKGAVEKPQRRQPAPLGAPTRIKARGRQPTSRPWVEAQGLRALLRCIANHRVFP
jgi:hypothetical protein